MRPRVVVTGLGVVAPNAVGIPDFEEALRAGRSGIAFLPELAALNFACQVGGIPPLTEEVKAKHLPPLLLRSLKSSGVTYGIIAAQEAWADAGLPIPDPEAPPDWESGCIFGSGMTGIEALRDGVYMVDEGKVKRLGSRLIEQAMASGISAHLGGLLGLGNQVTTNASACSTGTEAILLACQRIRLGLARRMVAGACDSHGPYVWGGFDSMRVLNRKMNDRPAAASRPMSATAQGFVPGAGAGAVILESLDSALDRGAPIYAEVLGGAVNAGGQRQGGSMTAPNLHGMQRCIRQALEASELAPGQVDALSGHLTATRGDALEVEAWTQALNRKGKDFPPIHSLKALTGHCLSAAGALECVAAVLQLHKSFFHAARNCEDPHPDILALIDETCIPPACVEKDCRVVAKSSFGFGDVNACLCFRRWEET